MGAQQQAVGCYFCCADCKRYPVVNPAPIFVFQQFFLSPWYPMFRSLYIIFRYIISSEPVRLQEGAQMPQYLGMPAPVDDFMKETIILAACDANEILPQTDYLPADIFTACLTTPIKAGLLR